MEDLGEDNSAWVKERGVCKMTTIALVSMLYSLGLLAVLITGLASPDLFISKTAQLFTAAGVSSASSDYVFDISDYKPAHQSIYFAMRLNNPVQLEQTMEAKDITKYEGEWRFNITAFGSPQPTLTGGNCGAGCVSCHDGDEELGLTCDVISYEDPATKTITCKSGEEWCSWVPLYIVDFVSYKTYYWSITTDSDLDDYVTSASPDSSEAWLSQFRVVFVSQWYTSYEMVWFYFWVSVTLLVMFMPRYGFFTAALSAGVHWRKWSRQQKWVGVLLVSLFFFNNPFFAGQIFSDKPKNFFIWFAIAEGTLVALLLLYWLDRLFELGRDSEGSSSKEGIARMAQSALTSIIFFAYVVNTIHLRTSSSSDPKRVHRYPTTSSTGEQALTLLMFIYCFWIVFLAIRAWWRGGVGVGVLRGSPSLMFFAVSSCVTVVVLVPSVILEYLSPRVKGGAAFSVAHGGCSLYILAMALLCSPKNVPAPGVDTIVSGTAINGIPQPPLPEETEENFEAHFETPPRSRSGFWRYKARPKIADSSVWEDVFPPGAS